MTHDTGKPNAKVKQAEKEILDFGQSYPETRVDHPWGESAIKVKGKTFVFLHAGGTGLSLSVKLVASHTAALGLPFTEPTGYGLGKSGWVTARFSPQETVPIPVLKSWIDESYRAVAPKKLADALGAAGVTPPRSDRPSEAAPRPRPRAASPRASRRPGTTPRRRAGSGGRGAARRRP